MYIYVSLKVSKSDYIYEYIYIYIYVYKYIYIYIYVSYQLPTPKCKPLFAQAFWSAVLRLEAFIEALVSGGAGPDVVAKWNVLAEGKAAASAYWAEEGPKHR